MSEAYGDRWEFNTQMWKKPTNQTNNQPKKNPTSIWCYLGNFLHKCTGLSHSFSQLDIPTGEQRGEAECYHYSKSIKCSSYTKIYVEINKDMHSWISTGNSWHFLGA